MRNTACTLILSAFFVAGIPGTALLAQDGTQAPATPAQATTAPDAQGAHHHANPQREAKHMAKKLNLTEAQEQQIEPILADRQQQMESLRADTSLAPQDRHSKARAIRQDSNNRIEAVLNDQQKQQFEQMQQSHHAEQRQQGMTAPSNS